MSKVVIDRAVVEQAMKAMLNFPGDISDEMFESIRALRAALAEPAKEPVAWLQPKTVDGHLRPDLGHETCSRDDYGAFAVYTAPPQRPAEPAQEPVAWYQKRGQEVLTSHPACWGREDEPWTPLYTAPPHQKQVGWMQKSTGVIRCDWGFDTTGYVPVYAVQEQSE